MRTHAEVRAELFGEDPELREVYDALQPEYELRLAIIEARLKAGLTQAELATKMGTTQSAVARLESGPFDPRVGTLRKLAAALGVQIEITADALRVVSVAERRSLPRASRSRLSKSA